MDGIYWTEAARQRVHLGYRALLAAADVPLQELHFPTRYGETCVFVCGSTQSPPLVLLHGANTNSAMWLRNLAVWSAKFRIYSIDVIGDPGFSAATRLPFHADEHALWLDDVLGSLQLARTHIVGASLGGWIGLDYAIRRPHAVDQLVLLAPAGIVPINLANTLELAALTLLGARGRRQAVLRSLGIADERLTSTERSFLAFCDVVMSNALSRVNIPAPIPDEQLRRLAARTLAVLGGRDVFFNSELACRRLKALVPMAKIQVLPDAGHSLADPTELVKEFLTSSAEIRVV